MTQQSRRRFFAAAGTAAFASAGCLTPPALLSAEEQTSPQKPAAQSKIPFRLGLASYTTRKFSLDQTLQMSARLGLKQICLKSYHLPLDAPPETIQKALQKAKAAGLSLYAIGVVYMNTPAEVDQAFACAKAAGMKLIVGVPLPDVLLHAERSVKETGISLAVHNHGPDDKLYPTLDSISEKIEKLDSRIGYCMDVGHTIRASLDPAAETRRYAGRLLDIHLKDESVANVNGECIEMGRGVIDIPPLFAALVETKYSGVASFEFEKDENDPLPGLAESVGYARGVSAML
jgi:inosose dehydratase